MIVVNIVPGIAHCQHEHLDPVQSHGNFFGRVAPAEHAAFPQGLAVAGDLEYHASLLADFVINADGGT